MNKNQNVLTWEYPEEIIQRISSVEIYRHTEILDIDNYYLGTLIHKQKFNISFKSYTDFSEDNSFYFLVFKDSSFLNIVTGQEPTIIQSNTDTLYVNLVNYNRSIGDYFNIEIDGTLYNFINTDTVSSATKTICDNGPYRERGREAPFDYPNTLPAGLNDLIQIYLMPDSGNLYIRNKTNRYLNLKVISTKTTFKYSHDGYNKSAIVGDNFIECTLKPRSQNNSEDSLKYLVKVAEDTEEVMLGIAYNFENALEPGNKIIIYSEWKITDDFLSDSFVEDSRVFIFVKELNTFKYLYSYTIDLYYERNKRNPTFSHGVNYIWFQFMPPSFIPPDMTGLMIIESDVLIQQLEMWNVYQVLNWGKYVVEEPYCVGLNWSGLESYTIDLKEDSELVPNFILIDDFNPQSFLNVRDITLKSFDTQIDTSIALNPIHDDESHPDFYKRVIHEDFDKITIEVKPEDILNQNIFNPRLRVSNTDSLQAPFCDKTNATLDNVSFNISTSTFTVIANNTDTLSIRLSSLWDSLVNDGIVVITTKAYKNNLEVFNYTQRINTHVLNKEVNLTTDIYEICYEKYRNGLCLIQPLYKVIYQYKQDFSKPDKTFFVGCSGYPLSVTPLLEYPRSTYLKTPKTFKNYTYEVELKIDCYGNNQEYSYSDENGILYVEDTMKVTIVPLPVEEFV